MNFLLIDTAATAAAAAAAAAATKRIIKYNSKAIYMAKIPFE